MTRWLKMALLVIVVGGSLAVGRQVDFERTLNPNHLAELLQSFGPWGPVVLILSMATAVIIPPIPSLPLDLASGAAFGPWFGTAYAVIGAAIGAILSFLIGRALGREGISRLFGVDAVFCEKCADHHVGLLVFLARLLPIVSFDVVSYGAGFTTISLRMFSLATIAGMMPATFAFVFLGSSVVSARWVLLGTSVPLVALFVLLPKWLKRHRTSRLAQVFFGPPPVVDRPIETGASPASCPACGGVVRVETPPLVDIGRERPTDPLSSQRNPRIEPLVRATLSGKL